MSPRNPAKAASSSGTAGSDPNVAALLTWFIPGAGHLYLGKGAFALGAFILIEGMYLLGLKLSGGMVFEFLQPELRTKLAPALTPEAGNVGALLYHMKAYGYGLPTPRLWPDWIKLGGALTAASGVLNVCLMVRAHVDARIAVPAEQRVRRPSIAILAGWLVPGLGHVLLGRRARGVFVFAALVGLFVLGTVLAEGSNLDRERHFYYWAGQFMLGLPALLAEVVHGHARVSSDIAYADAGVVFGSLAGLLNILALLDVYGQGERQLLGEPETTAEAEPAEAPAEQEKAEAAV